MNYESNKLKYYKVKVIPYYASVEEFPAVDADLGELRHQVLQFQKWFFYFV